MKTALTKSRIHRSWLWEVYFSQGHRQAEGIFTHEKNMQCFQPHYFKGAGSVDLPQCSTKGSIVPAHSWWRLCYLPGEVRTLGSPTAQSCKRDFVCPCHGSPQQIFNPRDLPERSGWAQGRKPTVQLQQTRLVRQHPYTNAVHFRRIKS